MKTLCIWLAVASSAFAYEITGDGPASMNEFQNRNSCVSLYTTMPHMGPAPMLKDDKCWDKGDKYILSTPSTVWFLQIGDVLIVEQVTKFGNHFRVDMRVARNGLMYSVFDSELRHVK